MSEHREYPPYTGHYWHKYGIDDDQVWSRRNYLIHDGSAKRLARRPFYINHVEGAIVPIFSPLGVQHVRSRLRRAWEPWCNYESPWDAAMLARPLDDLSVWPETDLISRHSDGILALRNKANGSQGPAVIDLLQWHGVLVNPDKPRPRQSIRLMLDPDALDLWSVAATLIAEGWTY
jgi:hypothetical protein